MKLSELKAIIRECIEEAAPKRRRLRTPEDTIVRANTIKGRTDKLASRSQSGFSTLSPEQKKKRMKTDQQYGTRGLGPQSIASDVYDEKGRYKEYRPKSSYKKSGVGKR